MKLVFKNIHIENFLSFRNADIDLSRPGYTSVIGVNNNAVDGAASNGAGKTAIFEAINWCLCGETIRGTKDVKNFYTDDGALVELSFSADNDNYKLIRSKEHSKYKTTLKIYINDEDKSGKGIRDSEKLLEQYLPDINSSLIGSVIILGQGLPQRFTNNTPSGRKEVLETLSKSDFMIKDLKDRIIKRKDILASKLRNLEDTSLQLKTQESLTKQRLEEQENKLANLHTFNREETLDQINNINDSISQYTEKVEALEKDTINRNAELSNINIQISELANKHTVERNEVINKFSFSDTQKKKLELEATIKALKQEIINLESIKDICPTCGQKLPNVTKIDTTEKHVELDKLKTSYEETKKQSEQEYNLMSEIVADIDAKFDKEQEELHTKFLDINKAISNNISDTTNYNKQLTELTNNKLKLQNILDNWQRDIDLCNDIITDMQLDISVIQEKILYNNNETDNIKEHTEIINKFYSVITRDFRGYLLSNIIRFIDSRAKQYSKYLFDNDSFEFKLDGNNISIYHADRQYENLSGGERQKVDIIVQFAIRDMLCKYLNFSSNILVLDELTDNLDSVSCDKLFNLISSNLNDVESIYIISHHSDYALPIDNEIIVRKGEDSISYIE